MKKSAKDQRPACNACGTKKVVKNGTSQGKQRFWCRHCGVTFHDDKPRYYPAALKQQALSMALSGDSVRDIAKALHTSHTTISNWIHSGEEQLSSRLRGIAWQMEQSRTAPSIIGLEKLPAILKKTKSKSPYALLVLDNEVLWLRTT